MEEIISKYFKDLSKEDTDLKGVHIFSNKNFRLVIEYLENSIRVITFAIVRMDTNTIFIPIVNKLKMYNDTESNILDSLLEETKKETIKNSTTLAPIILTKELFDNDDITVIDLFLNEPIVAKNLKRLNKISSYQLMDILNIISEESEKYIKQGNFDNTNMFDKIFKYIEKITSKERIADSIALNISTTLSVILEESPQVINDILKAIKNGKGRQLSAFIAAI